MLVTLLIWIHKVAEANCVGSEQDDIINRGKQTLMLVAVSRRASVCLSDCRGWRRVRTSSMFNFKMVQLCLLRVRQILLNYVDFVNNFLFFVVYNVNICLNNYRLNYCLYCNIFDDFMIYSSGIAKSDGTARF